MGEAEPKRRPKTRREKEARKYAALAPVDPARARRRATRALILLIAAWVGVVLIDAALLRTHVWKKSSDAGVSTLAGLLASYLWPSIWFGAEGDSSVNVRLDHRLMSSRTVTGTRTIDLDNLVRVRRFSMIGPSSTLDEYHLKDVHGVRLATALRGPSLAAVRAAVERASVPAHPDGPRVKVTRHARSGLGLSPGSRLPQGLHLLWGYVLAIATICVPAFGSYVLALQLSGFNVSQVLNS